MQLSTAHCTPSKHAASAAFTLHRIWIWMVQTLSSYYYIARTRNVILLARCAPQLLPQQAEGFFLLLCIVQKPVTSTTTCFTASWEILLSTTLHCAEAFDEHHDLFVFHGKQKVSVCTLHRAGSVRRAPKGLHHAHFCVWG